MTFELRAANKLIWMVNGPVFLKTCGWKLVLLKEEEVQKKTSFSFEDTRSMVTFLFL